MILAAAMFLIAVPAQAQKTINLYVAPNGNDTWSGTLPEPNPEGVDGPFASMIGARDAIRVMKQKGAVGKPVIVQLRGGVYRIQEAVVFEHQDSGTSAAPVTYQAYPGEKPELSGGIAVKGWTQDGALWKAPVDFTGPRPAPFSALWANGQYRHSARTPNIGEIFTTGKKAPEIKSENSDELVVSPHNAIRFNKGDIQDWKNIDDVLIVALHSWDITKLPVDRIDYENDILVMKRPKGGWDFNHWGAGQRYYAENVFEGLDAPGEWYLDRKEKVLYYMPMPGEDMTATEIVAPVARQLVVLKGDTEAGKFVTHLNFQGITFSHTDYSLPPEGMNSQQASASVNAAFHAYGARYCSIENCEITGISNYAIWLGSGCQDNRIVRNHIHDLGAGGVRIGEMGNPANDNQVCRMNTVDNNWIHDGGKIFHPAVGVWIGRSSYNTISHNEISDFYYTGVSVGWSWGYAPSSANHNVIEYNHIHNIGKRYLSDMGAIYLLGTAPGTICRYNLIHDIFAYSYGGWGIYPDEGSTHLLIENNIVYNTKTGGFHQHYGRENRVQNNIFAYAEMDQIQRTRMEKHVSFFFKRNIVFFNNGRLLGSNWKDDKYVMDFNCYWDESGAEMSWKGDDFSQWQARGQDKHSIAADPMFEDPHAFNFTLKPGSPVMALGFEPIDTSQIGLYGDEAWVNAPGSVEREPSKLPEPYKPRLFSDDFENTEVDAPPANATVAGAADGAAVKVSSEAPGSGARCLKFADKEGLPQIWNPHIYYQPMARAGKIRASFKIRLEKGALFYNEWRTAGHPYKTGPSIRFSADGKIAASGHELADIPYGEWFEIAIETQLGMASTKTYEVILISPDGKEQKFENIPFLNSDFSTLEWYGFVADANADFVTYIDDIKMEMID